MYAAGEKNFMANFFIIWLKGELVLVVTLD